MRNLGIVGLAALLALVGCAADSDSGDDGSSEDALTSSAPHPFVVAEMAPRAVKTFATPNGKTEICVIPKHFTEDGYAAKDAKKEQKLCKVDFNAAPGGDATAAGLAPKANSTNPATDVHEVTAQIGRDVVESAAEANAHDRKAKKIGRIKSSLDDRFDKTSTYAPSLMGYYATSRLLGNIGEVTPAVWRTVELSHHAKVAQLGASLTVVGSQLVRPMWKEFVATDAAAQKTQLFYTTDGGQLYGAFIPNVSGDEKDKQIDTMGGLTGSDRFHRLVDGRPIAQTIGTDFQSAVTTIVPMQGVVEMLVLDALMLQGDRLSGDNVSYVPYVFFQNADGTVDRMSQDDFDDAKKAGQPVPAGTVAVHKLYLNDVDAGLIVKNADSFQAGQEYGLLKQVKHVSPDLYARIRKLETMAKDPAFVSYLTGELRYTDRDVIRYTTMATAVSTLFHDRCTAGQLVLDLDIQKHVAKTNLPAGQGCN